MRRLDETNDAFSTSGYPKIFSADLEKKSGEMLNVMIRESKKST